MDHSQLSDLGCLCCLYWAHCSVRHNRWSDMRSSQQWPKALSLACAHRPLSLIGKGTSPSHDFLGWAADVHRLAIFSSLWAVSIGSIVWRNVELNATVVSLTWLADIAFDRLRRIKGMIIMLGLNYGLYLPWDWQYNQGKHSVSAGYQCQLSWSGVIKIFFLLPTSDQKYTVHSIENLACDSFFR